MKRKIVWLLILVIGAETNNVAFETYEAFCNVEIFIKMND